jgi:diguanylate cyclase (GGDEF)-like protein
MKRPDILPAGLPAAPASRQLWLYQTVARIAPFSYRNKIMLIAFLGTHVPLLALVMFFALQTENFLSALPVIGIALVATLFGTAVTLFLLNGLLRPILMTREAVHAYVAHGRLPTLPTDFRDEAGQLMADTVSSLTRLDAILESLTYVDQMTGLPNRDHLLRRLAGEQAERRPIALGIISVQNLDEILAGFGEAGGGVTLRTMAARLTAVAGPQAIIARVDGRRFAITCSMAPEAPIIDLQARTLLAALNREIRDGEMRIVPQCTMGVALAPEDASDAATLLDFAQSAVPPAAEADLAFFTQAGQTSARRQMDLQNALRRAVERQDFALHYQPVISATAGELPRIIGAEALLRWNHPELGPISPAVFIPIAERIGLMDEIGPWILQTGCAQLRAWDEAGLPPLRLAVNLSARQFSDRRLVTVIADFVQRFSVPPRRLEVEMTETAAMQDRATTRRVFGELRELGVTIAIDDFGTGYSTMSHLRDVTFDTLKIDREFVRDVDSTPSSRAICKALIELGRGLDIEVLAEGVERTEEVATLQTYGCSVFQGFYFGRPMPSADFTQAMREQASLAA